MEKIFLYRFNFTIVNSKVTQRGILFSDLPQCLGAAQKRELYRCASPTLMDI